MVVAWESLLKAKILSDNRNRLTSIYVRDGSRYKRNRTGHHLTISLSEATSRCRLPRVVAENVERLVEVRDAAVHLTAASNNLRYLVFTLAAATLKNYARLIRDWFRVGLSDYNFYILPLGFDYPFKTLSAIELEKEPEDVALIMSAVAKSQAKGKATDGAFALVCELKTALVSAKRITNETDLVAKVDPSSTGAVVVQKEVNLIDKYPYTWREVLQKIKTADAEVTQHDLNTLITSKSVKGDPKYSRYNFRSKRDQQQGIKPTTAVLYNDAFVTLAITSLCGSAGGKAHKSA
jgi:hypothetical protein